MKKIKGLLIKLILLLLVVAAGAVVWHEYPRSIEPTGSQTLFADLSFGTKAKGGAEATYAISGRLKHHQQCEAGLASLKVLERQGENVIYEGRVPVTVPEGAKLTFDLFIPSPLLMNLKSKVHFGVEFVEDGGGLSKILFDYNYRQDWIGLVVNFIKESWQVDYHFLDRFRAFEADFSEFAGKTGELVFTVEGNDQVDQEKMDKYSDWAGAPFEKGFTFLSPRVWTTAPRGEKDFNVVLCVIDGVWAKALSIYGYERQTTPNLAALADKSLVFDNAFSPSNATRTSMTAVLSGQYPSILGIPMPVQVWDLNENEKTAFRMLTGELAASTPSLPRYLASKGYATGFVGSNPFILPANYTAADLGFAVNESLNQKRYDTEAITERSLHFIEQNKERPFFLYIHFNNGHGPHRPPDEFKQQFDTGSADKAVFWQDMYDGEMAYADSKVQVLLDTLAENGLSENTLFIVTADHGMTPPAEKGHPKGHTHSLYNSQTNVPLILYMPGKVPEGKRSKGLCSLLDLYPTILAMRDESFVSTGDVPPEFPPGSDPNTLVGRNLLDISDEEERTIYLESAGIMALRTPDSKVIVKMAPYKKLKGDVSTDGGLLHELYDLATDPGETANLATMDTEEENSALEKLWKFKEQLASLRAAQIAKLEPVLGDAANALYPLRAQESFELALPAGSKEREYLIVVKPKRQIGSFLGRNFTDGDMILRDEQSHYLSLVVNVKAEKSKQFGFTPFPPDDPFYIEVLADGEPLEHLYMGPYALAFAPNPTVVEKARDLRLMLGEEPPTFDPKTEYGAFLWRNNLRTEAVTQMGGQIEQALRAWGYVQ